MDTSTRGMPQQLSYFVDTWCLLLLAPYAFYRAVCWLKTNFTTRVNLRLRIQHTLQLAAMLPMQTPTSQQPTIGNWDVPHDNRWKEVVVVLWVLFRVTAPSPGFCFGLQRPSSFRPSGTISKCQKLLLGCHSFVAGFRNLWFPFPLHCLGRLLY